VAKGWSQRELSNRAGVALSVVEKMDQGQAREPSLYAVGRISQALGLDLNELGRPRVQASLPAGTVVKLVFPGGRPESLQSLQHNAQISIKGRVTSTVTYVEITTSGVEVR
jgi:transcriptional regulator with XRE-family HTH domain